MFFQNVSPCLTVAPLCFLYSLPNTAFALMAIENTHPYQLEWLVVSKLALNEIHHHRTNHYLWQPDT